MPFNNSGEATFHGPYNDVAGSQLNITQVFSSTSTALISRTTANFPLTIDSLATMVAKTGAHSIGSQTIIMPKSKPFQNFIAIILDLQATLNPIIEVLGVTDDLRVLSQELSRTLMTTALAGRIIDFLEATWELRGLVWCRRLTDKVGRSIYTLGRVFEAVLQYRSGVRHRLTGSAEEQLQAAKAHFVSGERDIDGIAREAFCKLTDCTNPLERFLYCAGQSLMHRFKYSFHNKAIWQDLSAEIQSHLTIPRFRSPHGMITARGDIYPFDSYTTYSDLCMFLGQYNNHGWVDTASEQLLSPKHLSKLIRQQSAPHITVEPVVNYPVIGDSGQDSICPHCGSESSYGEWRVCISCGLRFQTTAPKLPYDHWLSLYCLDDDDRYVMKMRFNWSILSSVTHLSGDVPDSATAQRFLQLLSDVNSPISYLYIVLSCRPNIHIPNVLDTGSSPPILQHLTKLTLSSKETFDLPTLLLPQITQMTLYLYSSPDSPVIDWLLNFRSVTKVNLDLRWDDPLRSIQQLLLGLPALESLVAFNLPCITTSTPAQILETVRSICAQDHPIPSIGMYLPEHQAELELPDPWVGTYSDLVLHIYQL